MACDRRLPAERVGRVVGGYMSYQRMRTRNGLMFRKPDDDPDPYWRQPADDGWLPGIEAVPDDLQHGLLYALEQRQLGALIGDLNRMERGYLGCSPELAGESLSDEVARRTGIDVETVMRVLRCVFFEQP
jgi:hypothetical protein